MLKLESKNIKEVRNSGEYVLRYPIDAPIEDAKMTKTVKIKNIWEKFVESNWESAEPGCFFWDTIEKQSISDCYAEDGFKTITSNPCIVGETLIAVADGRNAVSIAQLAEEGKDVPVYCLDKQGNMTIRIMRNPRVTGFDKDIFEVMLDDGSKIECTGNHKFRTIEGDMVEATKLKVGESLHVMKKFNAPIVSKAKRNREKDYVWVSHKNGKVCEHRLIAKFNHNDDKDIPFAYQVHHKDFNSQNNTPDNLLIMSREDHAKLHTDLMVGDNNPMRKWYPNASDEEKQTYHDNMSFATSGEKNGRYSGITNEKIVELMKLEIISSNKPMTLTRWKTIAKQRKVPQYFTSFRGKMNVLLDTANQSCGFVVVCSKETSYKNREYVKYLDIKEMTDLDVRFDENAKVDMIKVFKKCEQCGKEIVHPWSQREISYCSSCSTVKGVKAMKEKNISNRIARRSEKLEKGIDMFIKFTDTNDRIPSKEDLLKLFNENGIKDFRSFGMYSYKEFTDEVSERFGVEINSRKSNNLDYVQEVGKQLKEHGLCYNHKVVSVTKVRKDIVYNGTVDEFHNFFIGGFEDDQNQTFYVNNANCGEILMSEYNSCILMLVNLASFVDDPYTKKAKFNEERFEKHMRLATRLIDDMLDLEIEKVKQIISKIKKDPESNDIKKEELALWKNILDCYEKGRRTGLGVTALGDMLAALNIKYGSDAALKTVDEVFKKFHTYTYDENAELAKERGAFPVWDWEKEKDSHYIKILPKKIQEKIKKYGRRNIASNTCAPAGSVSILSQTTSGIEPVFMRSYERNRKMTTEEVESGMKEAYSDSDGIKWVTYDVYHHGLTKWQETNPNKSIEESPYIESESGEIDWRFRVKLQGIVQKYIDHSISSTVNLSKDITKEEIAELYMEAHKNKCKGVTIYREGSRLGVLTSKKEDEENEENEENIINENHAPRRSQILSCEIHYSNIKNIETQGTDNWIFLVGLLEGKPYEVFGGKRNHVEIPKKYKNGWLVKNGKNNQGIRTYDLYLGTLEDSDERLIIKDIANEFSTNASSYTRIISTMLRHGVPIKIICEQLLKDSSSDMFTFEKGVSRVIKKFIKDGEKANGDCQDCGGELQYRDGCVLCPSCGFSKCQ